MQKGSHEHNEGEAARASLATRGDTCRTSTRVTRLPQLAAQPAHTCALAKDRPNGVEATLAQRGVVFHAVGAKVRLLCEQGVAIGAHVGVGLPHQNVASQGLHQGPATAAGANEQRRTATGELERHAIVVQGGAI